MRSLPRIFTSHISSKIIVPYLVLIFCVAAALTFVAVRLTVGALQERINNRLIEAAQVTSDSLVSVEESQLSQLRSIIFTEGVAEAIIAGDKDSLSALLLPHWVNARLYTLVIFDSQGQPLIHWQHAPDGQRDVPRAVDEAGLSSWWIVQQITQGQQDAFGDKFSVFRDQALYTAAPVRVDGTLIGGVMVAMPLDTLLQEMQSRSQAAITSLYDEYGNAVATTQVRAGDGIVPAIPVAVLQELKAASPGAMPGHVQSVIDVNGREYQYAYSPLQVRRSTNGYYSVGLSRQFIVDTWARERLPFALLGVVMVAGVAGIGMGVSQRITRPLYDLVSTAQAVTRGDLERRSTVAGYDELGLLAQAFNQMTQRLFHLYTTSRSLSARTHVESILTATDSAVQGLVPGSVVVVLLEEPTGWRLHVADSECHELQTLQGVQITDTTPLHVLSKQARKPIVTERAARRLRSLPFPDHYAEVCYVALVVNEQPIGLLFLLHQERGAFVSSVIEPLATVASMVTTALHNTRLYGEIQDEANRRRVILESIADGVLVCDADRNVVLMNAAAERLLEISDWRTKRYHFDQLPLNPVLEFNPLLNADGHLEVRYEAHGRILQASTAALSPFASGFAGEVIILHNVSEEVALDQAKTDLIALISHELRTPLTSILSANDMLIKGIGGQLSPLQQQLAETALRQSHAMSTLIEKAIMLANIESGSLEVNLQQLNVRDVIDATVRALAGAAAAGGATLSCELPRDLPPVMVDARLLKVAVQQIVDNAIKYGEGAPIEISARAVGHDVELTVKDTGPGIAPDDLPHLFRRMRRGSDSLNNAPRGMGLGLVITRELIERQGGSICAESRLGEGTHFTLLLRGPANVVPSLVA